MLDEIRIQNLKIFANHGVYSEEQENGQDFYVNAVLYTDTSVAGVTDDLENSTNYGEVCHFMNRFVTGHTFQLIETVIIDRLDFKNCYFTIKVQEPISMTLDIILIIDKWNFVHVKQVHLN